MGIAQEQHCRQIISFKVFYKFSSYFCCCRFTYILFICLFPVFSLCECLFWWRTLHDLVLWNVQLNWTLLASYISSPSFALMHDIQTKLSVGSEEEEPVSFWQTLCHQLELITSLPSPFKLTVSRYPHLQQILMMAPSYSRQEALQFSVFWG